MIAAVRVRLGRAGLREAMRRRVRDEAERRLDLPAGPEGEGDDTGFAGPVAERLDLLTKA